MTATDLHLLRARVAALFEARGEADLPPLVRRMVLEFGGTLIGPKDPDGPAEYQLHLLDVDGFGPSIEGAARQWTLNVYRMCGIAEEEIT